jgi:hypothetical protein
VETREKGADTKGAGERIKNYFVNDDDMHNKFHPLLSDIVFIRICRAFEANAF